MFCSLKPALRAFQVDASGVASFPAVAQGTYKLCWAPAYYAVDHCLETGSLQAYTPDLAAAMVRWALDPAGANRIVETEELR